MLSILISTLGILITIFFVVGTHELAHFALARLLHVKVLRFSIGFGKRLWHKFDKQGTEYVIALIPLGGYVKMLDENEGKVLKEEQHLAFNRQPFYKKFLIVLAGPLANLFCALILYWIIFLVGFTTVKPLIGTVQNNSLASHAGLKPKQEIIAVDQNKVFTWSGVILRIVAHVGNQDFMQFQVIDPSHGNQIVNHTIDLSNWHIDNLNPDPLASIGIKPYVPDIPLIIGIITAHSPAALSSLQKGDKIIAIDNKSIKTWEEITKFVQNHPAQTYPFTIERQKNILTLPIHIGVEHSIFFKKIGYLGIGPDFKWPKNFLREIKYSPFPAFTYALQEMINFTYFNLLLFAKMITGKLSLQSLGGPITIFETAGTALNAGWIAFIGFLAFLSISIGVINLFPIPGLDGGHLVIQTIEFLIRRPLPNRVIIFLYQIGFLFILFLLIQSLVNDVLRL